MPSHFRPGEDEHSEVSTTEGPVSEGSGLEDAGMGMSPVASGDEDVRPEAGGADGAPGVADAAADGSGMDGDSGLETYSEEASGASSSGEAFPETGGSEDGYVEEALDRDAGLDINPYLNDHLAYDTVSRADGEGAAGSYYREKGKGGRRKKRKVVLIVLGVIFVILAAVGITGGILAMRILDSVKVVKAEAQEIMGEFPQITDAIKETDSERLKGIAQDISTRAHNIQDEVGTDIWDIAAKVPVYGGDVDSARILSDVLVDLADNALAPIASNSDIMNLKNVFHDGMVEVGALQSLVGALDDAAPVISRCAEKVETVPPAKIDQVNEMVGKAKERIVSINDMLVQAQEILPYLPAMLGADGQTRNYLVIAQNNAEFRSCGGLPGSCGVMSITDGQISLGEFDSMLHWEVFQVDSTEEERAFFATNFDTDPAQANVVPDFERVGRMFQQYWEQWDGTMVDGVIALDPVFLQHMLALSGGFETSDGTYVDGTNAAFELMSNVYWRYGLYQYGHDVFFTEAAELAAKTFFSHIGDAGIVNFYEALTRDMDAHRLLVWMARDEEQNLVRKFNADNAIDHDIARPELGIYLNDDTYSKMSWYARVEINVGEGVKNEDGTTTHDVSISLANTMTPYEAANAGDYITGFSDFKRFPGDMIDVMIVLAPEGATITDIDGGSAEFVTDSWIYGVQALRTRYFTAPEESSYLSFRLTLPAEATEPLRVRATPSAQEGNLVINVAGQDQVVL